ncbi:MAG: DUF1501 domain-containing protein [Ignavibacteria bacterium]|nr:DUF1501 domain-containing protein [Ignavibacteria bacterium]
MKFKRRDFLKISAMASASLFIPRFIKADGKETFFGRTNGKIIVILQLSGGNDGLNCVIPYNNDIYYKSRPYIGIKKSEVVKLNDELGFNPNLKDLKSLYDKGLLSIVNNVGYPNPDRSHFRSMDIWQTASNSNSYLNSGWIGRYLDAECGDCSNSMHAIEADETLSLAMKGISRTGLAFQDPERFFYLSNKKIYKDLLENSKREKGLNDSQKYLYKTLTEATESAKIIYDKSKIFKSKLNYPGTQLGKNLKMIAELILSGIETSVYYTSFTGFDTHVNQIARQSELLKQYSEALKTFTDDLIQNNRINDVIVITFSEFGRRVSENASRGTDHGTAGNVYLIGGKLKKAGIFNAPPDLSDLDSGDLKYQVDFRSIYSDLLGKWLGADSEKILGRKFETAGIV